MCFLRGYATTSNEDGFSNFPIIFLSYSKILGVIHSSGSPILLMVIFVLQVCFTSPKEQLQDQVLKFISQRTKFKNILSCDYLLFDRVFFKRAQDKNASEIFKSTIMKILERRAKTFSRQELIFEGFRGEDKTRHLFQYQYETKALNWLKQLKALKQTLR